MIHTFDDLRHTYTLDTGQEVPSMTGILKATRLASYDQIARDILENRRALGALVHKATAILDKGYEVGGLAVAALPYAKAWSRFKAESNFEWRSVEEHHVESISGMPLGGTPDRVGVLEGRGAIIDIKISRQREAWWGLQLAGYALLEAQGSSEMAPLYHRHVVQLRDDATYRIHDFDDRADFDLVRAALCITWWMRNHGYSLDR